MKIVTVVLLVLVVVAIVLVAVLVARFGRRNYQRYKGLDLQRGAAKQARDAGASRLKSAERQLVEAQRELVGIGEHDQAQAIERLRTRLSTLADRLRYATYGYSPVGSANPVREAELAELQQRDAETITEAQYIVELSEQLTSTARAGQVPDLEPLRSALDHLTATLDRRRAVS